MAANPLTKYFYNGSVVRYTKLVAYILSELRLEVEGNSIRVPINFLGGIKNQDTTTYTVDLGLSSTLKFLSVTVPEEGVLNSNLKLVQGATVEKMPLPVVLSYEFRLRFKKFNDMAQVLEQMVFNFFPMLTVRVTGLGGRNPEKIGLNITSYQWDDDWDGSGEEASYYDLIFNIEMTGGHFYGRDLVADGDAGIIKEVDITKDILPDLTRLPATPKPLFSMYDEEVVGTRFPASKPLEQGEGAYVMKVEEGERVTEVIGSYTWTRPGY